MSEPSTPVADFEVTAQVSDGTAVVVISGEVDVYTAPQLRDCLRRIDADDADRVVLDLSAMTFIDSTGLGVIVGAVKRLRENGGTLTLRAPSKSTRKVLDITGLAQIIDIED
jgi:anti-sigma B factor antagonist